MTRDYEPPLSIDGDPVIPGREPELYAGVRGYALMYRGEIYIPMIRAEREGRGAVGRFLDSISPRCRIVNVLNQRLRGMLRRRGFTLTYREGIDIWAPPARREG